MKHLVNPYLPAYEFVPDGEPHIFGDRVYLYGSHDIFEGKICCEGDYVCWSAPVEDITEWQYEGVIYKRAQDPYIEEQIAAGSKNPMNQYLYAPDVVFVKDKYYIYYGVAMSSSGIGVAVADSPTGPFTYLGRVRYPESEKPEQWKDSLDGIEDHDMAFCAGIKPLQFNPFKKGFPFNFEHYPYDPAMLYDEGRLFMYYGCSYCRVIEIDTRDMLTVLKNPRTDRYESDLLTTTKQAVKKDPALANKDHTNMINGPSIRKIDGTYYLYYYGIGPYKCHALCYETASDPFGPFTYQGILISLGNAKYNNQTKPTDYTGNTHGGLLQIGDQWFINYHRQTGNRVNGRQACMVELKRNPDGSFCHSEYRSQVFLDKGLPADQEWPSYIACFLTDADGNTKLRSNSPYLTLKESPVGAIDDHTGKKVVQLVTNLTKGSCVGFKYLDFGENGSTQPTCAIVMQNPEKGHVEIWLDDPWKGQCIGKVELEKSEGIKSFSAPISNVSGTHGVYFKFIGDTKYSGDFLSFHFQ